MGSDRSFGMVFAAFFVLVGLTPLRHGLPIRIWALALAGLFLLVALLFPFVLRPLNRLWFRFGLLLGKITTPIVMGLFFFLAVTPMAWLSRRVGRDPLRLRRDEAAASYWIVRPATTPEAEAESLRRQF